MTIIKSKDLKNITKMKTAGSFAFSFLNLSYKTEANSAKWATQPLSNKKKTKIVKTLLGFS